MQLNGGDLGRMKKAGGCRAITKLTKFMKVMNQHMAEYTPENKDWSLVATGVDIPQASMRWFSRGLHQVHLPPQAPSSPPPVGPG